MFPEAALPDGALALVYSGKRALLGVGYVRREERFDGVPAGRIVGVARRQGPDAVQVVGEHDEGVDVERCACVGGADGLAEGVDFVGEQVTAAIQ